MSQLERAQLVLQGQEYRPGQVMDVWRSREEIPAGIVGGSWVDAEQVGDFFLSVSLKNGIQFRPVMNLWQ